MTRSTTGGRANQANGCTARPPFCQAPGRTACDSRAGINQNLPDGDSIVSLRRSEREQASIPQLEKIPEGSPVWAIRCPSGALNTTVEEPPASGMDSIADGVVPLVKSTRSPSALQLADPFGPRSTRCRGAEPSRGSTHRSRELCLILSSREPSGAEITESVTGQTAPERRRRLPTNERSQPVHVAVSHAAARILCPVAAPGVHFHSARVCDPLRLARVDDADLNARGIGIGQVFAIWRDACGCHRKIRRVLGELRQGGLTRRPTRASARRSNPPSTDRNACYQHNARRV